MTTYSREVLVTNVITGKMKVIQVTSSAPISKSEAIHLAIKKNDG